MRLGEPAFAQRPHAIGHRSLAGENHAVGGTDRLGRAGDRHLRAGRHVMVQQYLGQVDTVGETALVYIEGQFSHSVRKSALLEGPYRVDGLHKEEMTARDATDAERELADRVIAAIPELVPGAGDGPLLYARVDLLRDTEGAPVLLELELTEPSLFLGLKDGAVDLVADAITARVAAA